MKTCFIEPNEYFTEKLGKSEHYLNSPKYMINFWVDCMYRQGGLPFVINLLTKFKFDNVNELSKNFCDWRVKISFDKFNELNNKNQWENDYIPDYLKSFDKYVTECLTVPIEVKWSCGEIISQKFRPNPFIKIFV